MINYADGSLAQAGDRVDYDGELSIVDEVVDSPETYARWGLSSPGLMLRNTSFGLLFVPANAVGWDALVLVGRGSSTG